MFTSLGRCSRISLYRARPTGSSRPTRVFNNQSFGRASLGKSWTRIDQSLRTAGIETGGLSGREHGVELDEIFPVLHLGTWVSVALALNKLLPLPALDGRTHQ